MEQCRALNVTYCDYTTETNGFTVTLWNQLAQPKNELVRLPIKSASATVTDSEGKSVPAQVEPISARDTSLPLLYLTFTELRNKTKVAEASNKATHVLSFVATLPPVGLQSYTVQQGAAALADARTRGADVLAAQPFTAPATVGDGTTKSITNGHYTLEYSGEFFFSVPLLCVRILLTIRLPHPTYHR